MLKNVVGFAYDQEIELDQFFIAERSQIAIDLHGLLVADETKLRKYKNQMRSRNLSDAKFLKQSKTSEKKATRL